MSAWPADWPLADAKSPDRSICRFCEEEISWDQVCYTHDNSGWSDCGVTIVGGSVVGSFVVNPELEVNPMFQGKRAEPVTWDNDESDG